MFKKRRLRLLNNIKSIRLKIKLENIIKKLNFIINYSKS